MYSGGQIEDKSVIEPSSKLSQEMQEVQLGLVEVGSFARCSDRGLRELLPLEALQDLGTSASPAKAFRTLLFRRKLFGEQEGFQKRQNWRQEGVGCKVGGRSRK